MNKYWSNEDDNKVSYVTEHPLRAPRVNSARSPQEDPAATQPEDGAFSYSQDLNRPDAGAVYDTQQSTPPQYGADRSSFISEEAQARQRRETRHVQSPQPQSIPEPKDLNPYGLEYQIQSGPPNDPHKGGQGRLWHKLLVVILALLLIGGGAYVFRYEIISLIGSIFGEEAVWKIVPTPVPEENVRDVPAYTNSSVLVVKPQAMGEIDAVAEGLALDTNTVTEQNIVLKTERPDGTYDFYLFSYDSGRLLGYYEGLSDFIPCGKHVFYMEQEPYLITSRGFPLVDLQTLETSAGGAVTISPMTGGWATVKNPDGTVFNLIGENGELISKLWFCKLFPFTGDTTLAYVDTGNVTDNGNRYALYLLYRSGETQRLFYTPDTDYIMDSVCGMVFAQTGEILTQDASLSVLMTTDDATAYLNCGALVVRDTQTGLYGLFVNGVQQYPFAFDSIEPMPSDILWQTAENGYITHCTVANLSYPLPRSYSFILRKGDTEQAVSIAAVSVYPMLID